MNKFATRSRLARRCSIEKLEDRRLMAGDVFARIDHGNLIIRGDDAANHVLVEPGGVGLVAVTGFNDASGVATRVNGTANGAATLSGFTGRIEFDMRGGNDIVVEKAVANRGVIADLGRGDNELFIANQLTTGDMFIKGWDGVDRFSLDITTVTGSLTVDMGEGANNYFFSGSGVVGRDARYIAGRGNDSFTVQNTLISRKLTMDAGNGQNDFFTAHLFVEGSAEFRGGSGNDKFQWESGELRAIDIALGDGNNRVLINNATVQSNARVTTGRGDDRYESNNVTFQGAFDMNLGKGTNELRSTFGSIARDAKFSGGEGTDQFQFVAAMFGGKLTIDVGEGQDLLNMNGSVADCAEFKGGGGDDYFEIVTNFRRNFLMDGGSGNNKLNLFGGTAERDVEIRAGYGNDEIRVEDGVVLGKLNIDAGDGNNIVNVLAHRYSELAIKAGRGMDSVRIDNEFLGGGPTVVIRSVRVDVGGGTNSVELRNLTVAGKTEIKGGDNVDHIRLQSVTLAGLYVYLARGDDEVLVIGVTTSQKAYFDGDGGRDSFFTNADVPSSFAGLERKNFEIITTII